jgi:hypothetical protein
MSAAGAAQMKKDTLARGAKPRPEGRVRERGWRPTNVVLGFASSGAEGARRRVIEAADGAAVERSQTNAKAA